MPNRDGTGPEGQGTRTGRGLGNCDETETKSTKRKYLGRRRGNRRGGRQGRNMNNDQ